MLEHSDVIVIDYHPETSGGGGGNKVRVRDKFARITGQTVDVFSGSVNAAELY